MKNKQKSLINVVIRNNLQSLSKRELECTILLLKGKKNSDISNILTLAYSTVSTYKKRIFKKTNTNNIIELNEYFKKRNLRLYKEKVLNENNLL